MDDGLIRRLGALAPPERAKALDALPEPMLKAWNSDWPSWAHEGQLPPDDDWTIWVMLAGRGFGKTRAGAEYVSAFARANPKASIALVAANPRGGPAVMVGGERLIAAARRSGAQGADLGAGALAARFAGGAEARLFSAASPIAAGPEHHLAGATSCEWPKARRMGQSAARASRRRAARAIVTPRRAPAARFAGCWKPGPGATRRDSGQSHRRAASLYGRGGAQGHPTRPAGAGRVVIEEPAGALWPALCSSGAERGAGAAGAGRPQSVGADRVAVDRRPRRGRRMRDRDLRARRGGVGHVLADLSQGGLSPRAGRQGAAAAETWGAERVSRGEQWRAM